MKVPVGRRSIFSAWSILPHAQWSHPYNILPHPKTSSIRQKRNDAEKKEEKRREKQYSLDPATIAYSHRPHVEQEAEEERVGGREKTRRMKEKEIFMQQRGKEDYPNLGEETARKKKIRESQTERACEKNMTEAPAPPFVEANEMGVGASRDLTRRRRRDGTAKNAATSSSSSSFRGTSSTWHRMEIMQTLLAKSTKEAGELREENRRLRKALARSFSTTPTLTTVQHAGAEDCTGEVQQSMAKRNTGSDRFSFFSSSFSSSVHIPPTRNAVTRRKEKTKRRSAAESARHNAAEKAGSGGIRKSPCPAVRAPHAHRPTPHKALLSQAWTASHPLDSKSSRSTTTTASSFPPSSSSSSLLAPPPHAHASHSWPKRPSPHRSAPQTFSLPTASTPPFRSFRTPSAIETETTEGKKRKNIKNGEEDILDGRPRHLPKGHPTTTPAADRRSHVNGSAAHPLPHPLSPTHRHRSQKRIHPVGWAAGCKGDASPSSSLSPGRKPPDDPCGMEKATRQPRRPHLGEPKMEREAKETNFLTCVCGRAAPSAATAAAAALAGIHPRDAPATMSLLEALPTPPSSPAMASLSTHAPSTRRLRRTLYPAPMMCRTDDHHARKQEESRPKRSGPHTRKIPRPQIARTLERAPRSPSRNADAYTTYRNPRTDETEETDDVRKADGTRWRHGAASLPLQDASLRPLRHGHHNEAKRSHTIAFRHRRSSPSTFSSSFSSTTTCCTAFSSSTVFSIAASLLQWYQQMEGVTPAGYAMALEDHRERRTTTRKVDDPDGGRRGKVRKEIPTRHTGARRCGKLPPPSSFSETEEGRQRSTALLSPPSHDGNEKIPSSSSFSDPFHFVPFPMHHWSTKSPLRREVIRRRRKKEQRATLAEQKEKGALVQAKTGMDASSLSSSLCSHRMPPWKREEKKQGRKGHTSSFAMLVCPFASPRDAAPEEDVNTPPPKMLPRTARSREEPLDKKAKGRETHTRRHRSLHACGDGDGGGPPPPPRHGHHEEERKLSTPPPPPPTVPSFFLPLCSSLSTGPAPDDVVEALCNRAEEPEVPLGEYPTNPPHSSATLTTSSSHPVSRSSSPPRHRRTTCRSGEEANADAIPTPDEKETKHHEKKESEEPMKEKQEKESTILYERHHRIPTPPPPVSSPSFLLSPLPPPLPCMWEEREREGEGPIAPAATHTSPASCSATSSLFSSLSSSSSTVHGRVENAVHPVREGTLAAPLVAEERHTPEEASSSLPPTFPTPQEKKNAIADEEDEAATYRLWKLELEKKLRVEVESKRVKAVEADKKDVFVR